MNKTKYAFYLSAVVTLILPGMVVSKETTHEIGPLYIKIETPHPIVPLSETIKYTITVRTPEHTKVELTNLATGDDLGDAKVLAIQKQGPDKFEGEFGILSLSLWNIELEPLAEGHPELGEIQLKYQSGDEGIESITVPWPKVEVRKEYVRDADPNELRPLPELESVKTSVDWGLWLRWAGITILLVVIVWVASSMLRTSRESLVTHSLSKINQVENVNSPYRKRIEETCEIIRDYLERRYDIAISNKTTTEFLGDSNVHKLLTAGQQRALSDFLTACDTDKFSAPDPSEEEWRRCLAQAKAFLAGEKTT